MKSRNCVDVPPLSRTSSGLDHPMHQKEKTEHAETNPAIRRQIPCPFFSRQLCREAHIVSANLKGSSEDFHGKGGKIFSCRKNTEILGAHEIGAAISGPRIADKNFTDTRIFLRTLPSLGFSGMSKPPVKTRWLVTGDLVPSQGLPQ